MKHLRFGRIIGMSSRRGDAIFLDDILNEAKTRALEAIKTSPSKNSLHLCITYGRWEKV